MSSRCASCDIEIHWQPTVVDGKEYCCLGCSRGGPCTCNYENLPRHSTSMVLFSLEREESTTIRVTLSTSHDTGHC